VIVNRYPDNDNFRLQRKWSISCISWRSSLSSLGRECFCCCCQSIKREGQLELALSVFSTLHTHFQHYCIGSDEFEYWMKDEMFASCRFSVDSAGNEVLYIAANTGKLIFW